ncbi:MAG: hypothetical protein GF335_00505 [Candidatus Moranbacteria bacterium]|nr:hypothetical protein [Candidatus Moranbacteria bacterium]
MKKTKKSLITAFVPAVIFVFSVSFLPVFAQSSNIQKELEEFFEEKKSAQNIFVNERKVDSIDKAQQLSEELDENKDQNQPKPYTGEVKEVQSQLQGSFDVVVNGGFERGAAGWSGDIYSIIQDGAAYSGNYLSYLGSYGNWEEVYQQVSIPPGSSNVTISYYYAYLDDSAKSGGYGGLCVFDADTMAVLTCNLKDDTHTDNSWYQASLDITAYSGMDILIGLVVENAESGYASTDNRLLADNVSVNVATTGSVSPVYRLYIPGRHFYTMSDSERDKLVAAGWEFEGITYYAYASNEPGTNPVYRLYIPGRHVYTSGTGERDKLVNAGWEYEGIVYHAFTSIK